MRELTRLEMVEKTEQQQAFEGTVERLYVVFGKYPLRPDTEPCPHCVDPEDEQSLHLKPLRELDGDDLEKYAWSALYTWGTNEDYKHFLPRLFQLAGDPRWSGWVDTPVLFSKLNYGDWHHWPEDEQAAVREYLLALWRYCLSSEVEYVDIGGILCGIAQAADDLTPYLEVWRKSGRSGHFLLASFIASQFDPIAQKRKLSNSFWRDKHDPGNPFAHDRTIQMNQVIGWLLDPATKTSLEEAFFIEQTDELATAVDTLDWLAKRYPPETEQRL